MSDNNDRVTTLLNKSNIILLVWFLAIYFIVYFVLGVFYSTSPDEETKEIRMSKILDIMVFSFAFIYGLFTFINMDDAEKESMIPDGLKRFLSYSNDPYSIFAVVLFLLSFYVLIYILRIPMNNDTKPTSITIIENISIILFIVLLISDFFKLVLKINILEYIINGMLDGWNSLASGKDKTDTSGNKTDTSGNKTDTSGNNVDTSNKDEVFNISNNIYTYDDAQSVCSIYGAKVATYDQIEKSYDEGAEWCNYGWSDGQMAFFPTQKNTWDKLQGSEQTKNQCGRPGINGGYMANPQLKFGVNCFGKKPKATAIEKDQMYANSQVTVPTTSAEDSDVNRKVKFWKENADKLLVVNSFNRSKWSEY